MLRKAVVLGSLDQTCFLSPWHMLELSQVTRLRVVQGHEDGSGCGWVQPPQVEPPGQEAGHFSASTMALPAGPLSRWGRGSVMKRFSPGNGRQYFYT